jgi:tRNA-specific 2-thiouridylase
LTKDQVRAIAGRKKLHLAEKPESQEICFVPSGRYSSFIEAYVAEQDRKPASQPGEVVTRDGRVLGEHQGLYRYTVGQRKGLGVALGTPLYVIELDRARNRVVVGPGEELLRKRCVVRDVNWICPVREGESLEAQVKIRNNHHAAPARVEARSESEALVEFLDPQRAVTPGQAAVFYSGDEVLGGGWISRVLG